MSCWINQHATPTSNFLPVRQLDPDCFYKFAYLMANSADPDRLASSEGRVYTGSAGQGLKIFEPVHVKTNKMAYAPSKDSDHSLLSALWVVKDPSFLYVDSKDSYLTGRMHRLIWVLAECICHFVGFVEHWLNFLLFFTKAYLWIDNSW